MTAAPRTAPALALAVAILSVAGCHDKQKHDGPTLAASVAAPRSTSQCAADAWPTYGHDPGRTGATKACCKGPLRLLWRFAPPSSGVATHAIATKDAVYVAAQVGNSPAVYRVSLDGNLAWIFNSHADVTRARWPSAALGRIVLNDDGFFWLMPRSGKRVGPHRLDTWGQTLSDGKRLYAVNELHLDGPGVFIGAFDRSVKPLWKANKYIKKHGRLDILGAMALDGGRLYQVSLFKGAVLSGLFAFDPASGKRRWAQRAYPDSAVSAAHDRIYLVEMDALSKRSFVARDGKDGAVLWSRSVDDTDHQAPVVAGDRVLGYGPKSGIVARDAKSGKTLWTAGLLVPGKDRPGYSTALAAALGSRTLVAASGPDLAVLSLDTGHVQWKGHVASLLGDLHSPIIAGGRVYVVSHGILLALSCTK